MTRRAGVRVEPPRGPSSYLRRTAPTQPPPPSRSYRRRRRCRSRVPATMPPAVVRRVRRGGRRRYTPQSGADGYVQVQCQQAQEERKHPPAGCTPSRRAAAADPSPAPRPRARAVPPVVHRGGGRCLLVPVVFAGLDLHRTMRVGHGESRGRGQFFFVVCACNLHRGVSWRSESTELYRSRINTHACSDAAQLFCAEGGRGLVLGGWGGDLKTHAPTRELSSVVVAATEKKKTRERGATLGKRWTTDGGGRPHA
jgi:hypothetical protein